MPQRLVVVGGGVMGLGAAWVHAKQGWSVDLYEAERPGAGASGAAAGMLGVAAEWAPQELDHARIGRASAALWPAFAELLEAASGVKVALDTAGTLLVARDRQEVEDLRRRHQWLAEAGIRSTWCDRAALQELEPELSPRMAAGLRCEDEHQVDNRQVVAALDEACRRAGVRVRSQRKVEGLHLERGSVCGVRMADEEVCTADRVVLANGAWLERLQGWPSPPPKMRPVKGQMLSLRMPVGALRHVVRAGSTYLVPKQDGRLVLGATQEEQGYDRSVTAGGVLRLLDHAWELLPIVEDWELLETWAGLRPTLAEGMPLVGPTGVEGLWMVAGHHRSGILELPLTLQGLQGMLRGEDPPETLRPCLASRWPGVHS